MTATTAARLPVVRALLEEARRKGYHSGVLGVRAKPEWVSAPTFRLDDVPVTVVPCVSALAVREALLERAADGYLVVLTDRDERDLGAGVLTHLIWQRLRTPDPWEAVRHAFAATGIDQALTAGPDQREVATGLLAATPVSGWPPAPAGVLTRDHAHTAVATAHLAWPPGVADVASVLGWSARPDVVARLADLRALAGDPLTDAVVAWVAERARVVRTVVEWLLRAGTVADTIPLGLLAGVLVEAREAGAPHERQVAGEALVRLEAFAGSPLPPPAALTTWGSESAIALDAVDREGSGAGDRLRARADDLLHQLRAEGLAHGSDVLRAGLDARLVHVADTLRAAAPSPGATGVEAAWSDVQAHRLAADDSRVRVAHSAVRLHRWLALPDAAGDGPLAEHVVRHRDADAWADAAVNDVAGGTGHPAMDEAFEHLLRRARERRAASDAAFAAALAAHTRDDPAASTGGAASTRSHGGVWHVEDLLPDVVLPLAQRAPVLLLVLDGMSAAVATEVVDDVTGGRRSGWAEALVDGQQRRAATLAVLPTLTTVSRTSLLCGRIAEGTQADERHGYAELTRAAGLRGAELFHKKPLDSSRLGFAVADDVRVAIADTVGRPLVTCVLNTVDDALDRSDPGGTYWGADAVRHLRPLLELAQRAQRVVVLTSDHGHVIERRQGQQRRCPVASSARSRAADPPPQEGEVLVEGRRVALHGGQAVLAVDEGVRFGPLKAGYHGGGSPAEAVIPVVVLVPAVVPEGAPLHLAPPQAPAWWSGPIDRPGARAPAPTRLMAAFVEEDTLFSLAAPAPPGGVSASAAPDGDGLAAKVVASPTWAAQRALAARVTTPDAQVLALLRALLAARAHRLAPVAAATALGVPQASVMGPVRHVQQLLNVEGYPVLGVDPDGVTVVLDVAMLREQFEVDA